MRNRFKGGQQSIIVEVGRDLTIDIVRAYGWIVEDKD